MTCAGSRDILEQVGGPDEDDGEDLVFAKLHRWSSQDMVYRVGVSVDAGVIFILADDTSVVPIIIAVQGFVSAQLLKRNGNIFHASITNITRAC